MPETAVLGPKISHQTEESENKSSIMILNHFKDSKSIMFVLAYFNLENLNLEYSEKNKDNTFGYVKDDFLVVGTRAAVFNNTILKIESRCWRFRDAFYIVPGKNSYSGKYYSLLMDKDATFVTAASRDYFLPFFVGDTVPMLDVLLSMDAPLDTGTKLIRKLESLVERPFEQIESHFKLPENLRKYDLLRLEG